MIKKIIAGTLISAVTLFALPNNELELVMISKATHKKAVVLSNMNLKDEVKENRDKSDTAISDITGKMQAMELRIIQAIHDSKL